MKCASAWYQIPYNPELKDSSEPEKVISLLKLFVVSFYYFVSH